MKQWRITRQKETSTQMAERLLRIHALREELTSSPSSHDVLELAIAAVTSRSGW